MLDLLTVPFFQRALLVGSILGMLMAILGVLVVLRKMSFFSDAIGHSALAGIALALLVNVNPFLGALVFALLVALGISGVKAVSKLSIDTLLGVFFAAAVGLGVIVVSLTPGYQADLISFLFGNILTVTTGDIISSLVMTAIVLAILIWAGKGFVAITLDQSLARAEGIPVARLELLFLLLLAAVIALAIKFVGIVLVTALLIIPAASAQNIASSLASMFWISIGISLVAVIIGMLASALLRIPSGPTIVLTGTIFFAISLLYKILASKHQRNA
jgi:zinc transport system permease protein